jgi:hypothetical protein
LDFGQTREMWFERSDHQRLFAPFYWSILTKGKDDV